MVPARGYRLETFRVAGLKRSLSLELARSVGLAAVAPVACLRILRRVRPQAVLGGGSYVAGPMVAAAAALRIPVVATETDSQLGLANRLAAPLARAVFLAFPIDGLAPPKYRVVGRPVEPAFFTTAQADARAAYGVPADERVVAVFGGSLGAGRINAAAAAVFGGDEPRPGSPLVLHVTGRGKLTGIVPNDRYRVFEYCETMPQLLAAADVVVCRASGSVFEVAAAGRPAILVPWAGAAGDHQAGNARVLVAAGAAVAIPDAELDAGRLGRELAALLGDEARRAQMRAAMRAFARPQAGAEIAAAVLALAAGGEP
jgi:UDP-N-acetylglucosamine--N-acetylmuramyl-(pentapeptide) pyrophosphoryl-undecaprenol N-acetylglucosamine transferase